MFIPWSLPFTTLILGALPKAKVAELVDAHDSKSCSFGSVGSIPTFGTQASQQILLRGFLFCFSWKHLMKAAVKPHPE